MGEVMADQRTVAAEGGGAVILDKRYTVGHVVGVEIDEVLRIGNAVRIVASGAGRLFVHDMETMPPIATQGTGCLEALVA